MHNVNDDLLFIGPPTYVRFVSLVEGRAKHIFSYALYLTHVSSIWLLYNESGNMMDTTIYRNKVNVKSAN